MKQSQGSFQVSSQGAFRQLTLLTKNNNEKKTGGNDVLNKLTQTEENITFVG